MDDTFNDERSRYSGVMGTDLGRLCYELRDDFDWLRGKWSEFHELFGKGQERIDLLNTAASNFFYFLHRLLFEDAMLHLCRLTDPPPQMGGHKNLTVMALPLLISDPELRTSAQTKLEEVRKNCQFARKWRNRRLAHTDLVTMRERDVSALPPVDATNIDAAVKSIGEMLGLIEDHFDLPHILLGGDPWGAKSLVYYLQKAKRAIDDEHQHWIGLAKRTTAGS